MHDELSGAVIELVGVHRFDDAEFVGGFCEEGETVTEPLAALAVLLEGVLVSEHFWDALDEGELFACEERGWAIAAVESGEVGFMIEEFELAGAACHVEVDDAFGAGGEVGRGGAEWLGGVVAWGGGGAGVGTGAEPEGGESERAVSEEVPAGGGEEEVAVVHRFSGSARSRN